MQEKTHSDAVQAITYDSHHQHLASISQSSLQVWNVLNGRKSRMIQVTKVSNR